MEDGSNFIDSTLGVVLRAPFVLVAEIGMKLPFLKRKTIEQILAVAVLVAAIEIVVESGIRFVLGRFSLYSGRMPLVVRLTGLLILVAVYVIYEICDFKIYHEADYVLQRNVDKPQEETEVKEEPEVVDVPDELSRELESIIPDADDPIPDNRVAGDGLDIPELGKSDMDRIAQDMQELDISDLGSMGSLTLEELDDLAGSTDVRLDKPEPVRLDKPEPVVQGKPDDGGIVDDLVSDYKEQTELKVADILSLGVEYAGSLTNSEIADIEQRLAEDKPPLDEALGQLIEEGDENSDNFAELDSLEDWGIPSYFNMMV